MPSRANFSVKYPLLKLCPKGKPIRPNRLPSRPSLTPPLWGVLVELVELEVLVELEALSAVANSSFFIFLHRYIVLMPKVKRFHSTSSKPARFRMPSISSACGKASIEAGR